MSETDSFIEEVTEEVRRDKLFAMFRRYGWIGVLAVLLIVGGAAWNEWRKAQDRAAAEALGDAMIAALEGDNALSRAAALSDVPAEGPGQEMLVALARAGELSAGGDNAGAVAALQQVAANGDVPEIYRRIAGFRALTLQTDMPPEERRRQFEALSGQGGILRLLAEEQIALIDIGTGARDAALDRLGRIMQDAEATAGLRRRASQLIVALGGEVPQIASGVADTPVEQ
ncbi:hypothetical protein SAMN05216196_10124 [Lutimaribacter pacificus]|uniref:Ancillary SecYEG translocon subunit/Cell division coordinator CpoB TPR domain-containing protein n=1 Tax=Lutimaribacter pacificus TaxID=391948 RepID=A0A1H0A4G2_9RHOB|nr:tetratricopeptide repeat protein [Lutimaribacter pacificus]SDN28317.1 hypothetical protein SAMN05216196_10124 [Lutimaribacter pacificus]SHJ73469.1 hypothetical protein SAMN05444142_1011193 [Lutimaribacter pacificus]